MSSGKVHIILVNYGTPEDTIECLESVRQNDYEDFQTVVVDVRNKNNSLQRLNEWIHHTGDARFVIIKEKKNGGFAYANNVGIRYALNKKDGEFIWLLNSDTVIKKDALEQLVNCYRFNEKRTPVGFLGSKIMDYSEPDKIQSLGGSFNKWTGYSILKGLGEKDLGQYDREDMQVDYVVGASMFFHVSLAGEIGLMPEEYFLYYEDIDWSLKAKQAGFKNIICPRSTVWHKQGASTGALLQPDVAYSDNRKYLYSSYLLFYKKNFKLLLPVAYAILLKQWAGRIYHGNYKEAETILKVIKNKKV